MSNIKLNQRQIESKVNNNELKSLKLNHFCLLEGASGGIEPRSKTIKHFLDIFYVEDDGSPMRPTPS